VVHTGLRGVRMPTTRPELDQLLRTAIEQTRLLRLRYREQRPIVGTRTTTENTTAPYQSC